jgi:NAD(P)-dependent dehydrogenase (short-subunit alcohol dehydrogenase family)
MNKGFAPNGRVAIVTGGNGGVGFGMARGLAAPAPASGLRLPSITT